jgi:hypothetical protein
MSNNKAIVKFNNGNLAMLCNECRTIIKTGKDFTKEELDFVFEKGKLSPQYCEDCKSKLNGSTI